MTEARPSGVVRAALVSAAVVGGLVAVWMFTRPRPVTLIGDSETLRHGLLTDAFRQLSSGRLPLWTTGRWGGSPLIGDPDLGALYLPYYLGYALTPFPHWRALDISACAHLALLIAGTVWFLGCLGARPLAAVTGALLLVVNPTVVVVGRSWAEYWAALSYWPWLFGAATELSSGRRLGLAWLALCALAAQVYAGYPQFALYSGVPALAWIAFRPGPLHGRRIAIALTIGTGAIGLAAPQILPGLAMARGSMRAAPDAASRLAIADVFALSAASWKQAFSATAINPLLPCKLAIAPAIIALIGATRVRFVEAFLLAVFLLTAFLSTGPGSAYHLLQRIPPFGFFVGPIKFFYVAVFVLIVLAGLGLERVLSWPASARRAVLGLIALSAIPSLAMLFPGVPAWLFMSVIALAIVPVRALDLALGASAVGASFCFLLATRAHVIPEPWGAAVFGPFRSLVERAPLPPEGVPPGGGSRWLALAEHRELTQVGLNYGALWGIESFNGVGALAQWRQIDVMEHARPDTVIALAGQLGADPVVVLSGSKLEGKLRQAGYRQVGPAREDGLRILSSGKTIPRYALIPSVRPTSAREAIEAARGGEALGDETALIELGDDGGSQVAGGVTAETGRGDPNGRLEPLEERPGSFRANVAVSRPTWLVAREPFYRNWRATIDGVVAPIYPAGGFFIGVRIPPGRHDFRLEYREPGLLLGAGIALATLIVFRRALVSIRASRR
jgi:hypothetical protein